ncbi:MAG: cyclic nucleotide-binding/CBS domain-containing protein [Promethearchaeota archaeon]
MGLSTKEYYVKDLIIDDEYGTISSKATINEAAKKMKELGIPDLVVVEEGSENVLGVIGDFDIVQDVIAEGLDPKTANVITAMYKITPVSLNTPVVEAFTRMRDLQANVVPVVEKGKLLGVCSIQDCWSFIPDENVDEIGFFQVNNTRMAEFLLTAVCSILAVLLGIVLPFGGAYGFFMGNQTDLSSLFGIVFLTDGKVTFQLFEARGINYFVTYLDIFSLNGAIWIAIMVFSVLILIFGLISLFSLIYTSYTGKKYTLTEFLLRNVFPIFLIVFMIIEWILFGSAFLLSGLSTVVVIDPLGLTMSIISMVLIIAAINHDRFFRQKGVAKNREVK